MLSLVQVVRIIEEEPRWDVVAAIFFFQNPSLQEFAKHVNSRLERQNLQKVLPEEVVSIFAFLHCAASIRANLLIPA